MTTPAGMPAPDPAEPVGLGPLRVPIERVDLIRYAGASGDFNPIHWSDDAARAAGLPGVIAHGMYSMGVAARLVSGYAEDPRRIERLHVRFSAPIRPGDTLIVHGRALPHERGGARVEFWAEDAKGERVLSRGAAELGPGSAGGDEPGSSEPVDPRPAGPAPARPS